MCQEVVCSTEATAVGTLGLLREIELASLTVGDVQVVDGVGCGVATIFIAASKRDTRAVGCKRALGCRCPEATCPVRAARTLSARAQLVQGPESAAGADAWRVRRVYAGHGASTAGVGGVRPQGRQAHSGHSRRTTGTQLLAAAGLSEGRISYFGRWVSRQMLSYARESLLLHEAWSARGPSSRLRTSAGVQRQRRNASVFGSCCVERRCVVQRLPLT